MWELQNVEIHKHNIVHKCSNDFLDWWCLQKQIILVLGPGDEFKKLVSLKCEVLGSPIMKHRFHQTKTDPNYPCAFQAYYLSTFPCKDNPKMAKHRSNDFLTIHEPYVKTLLFNSCHSIRLSAHEGAPVARRGALGPSPGSEPGAPAGNASSIMSREPTRMPRIKR